MREFAKENVAGIQHVGVLRDAIQKIGLQLKEQSAAIQLLGTGRAPAATSTPTPGGVTDHGALTGLADDDHLQYLLLAGRAGGQVLASLTSELPLTIAGGSNQAQPVQRWQSSNGATILNLTLSTGSGSPVKFATAASCDMYLYRGTGALGLEIINGGIHITAGKFGTGTIASTPALLGIDAAAISSSVADTDDNIRIVRRSSGQFAAGGYALRVMEESRSTTLMGILADGTIKTPGIGLMDATGDLLAIVPSAVTTAHTLTMPATQGAASTVLQNNGSGALSWAAATGLFDTTANYTMSGTWAFTNALDIGSSNLRINSSGQIVDFLAFTAPGGSGGAGVIDFTGVSAGSITLTCPNASGEILIANSVVTMQNKTLQTNCSILCNSAAGVLFKDSASTTKQMRLNLSGITAGTTRTFKIQDTAGSAIVVGNTTSAAGVLGISDLTAQTGNIGAVTLLTGGASTAGMYRVNAYVKTTTAGTALDVVAVTIAWNDGAAQTNVPIAAHDLATNNAYSQGSAVVYSATSQNITYTTTVTKTGTPQYEIHLRIEWLG